MSVSILLTSKQKTAYNHALRASKLKPAGKGNTIEVTATDYPKVCSALQAAWFKVNVEHKHDETLLHLVNRLDALAPLFEVPAPEADDAEENLIDEL